jgi:hypothetical protein
MGASSYGVGYTSFVCRAPKHWVFAGTGMKRNDSIPDFVGWEYHGLPTGDNKDLVILAQNTIYPNRFKDANAPDHTATIYTAAKGNFVFNAGTCWWSMLLATPPGFKNPVCNQGADNYRVIDFSKGDKRVQQMTKNLLNRCLITFSKAHVNNSYYGTMKVRQRNDSIQLKSCINNEKKQLFQNPITTSTKDACYMKYRVFLFSFCCFLQAILFAQTTRTKGIRLARRL